jgi:ParB family chromosome partitioning protein
MAQAAKKIVLSASRDIPFNKLVLSQANVRRVKAGVSIEELAEDIARRGLLQGLSVRPVLDGEGEATGMFEVPAGGRRYRAIEHLVRQKRLAKTAPVPCVVKMANDGISAEEDSLAENVRRIDLHPLDQFRAFRTLREQGQDEEEIAARFFVPVQVVRQRLKLASVSPKLLDLYAEDQITLEHVMAFSVTNDHARQEQVWEALQRSPYKEAYQIRRMLTDGAVRASDKRAQFVGIDAYAQAGGTVMRDLFQADDGGWLQDPVLLDRLAIEKLEREAEAIRAEGWKWVEVAPDFAYGHANRLRRLRAEVVLSEEEQAAYDALQQEYGQLEEAYADSPDDLPEEVDARLGEIETALDAFHNRVPAYEPDDIARAGAFVSIDSSGTLKVERGFVRPEDEAPVEPVEGEVDGAVSEPVGSGPSVQRAIEIGGGNTSPVEPPEEEDGLKPIPERLLTELTAHRTLALRDALANDPDTAFLTVLHALALKVFYRFAFETCLEIEVKSASLGTQAPGLGDTAYARAVDERHKRWADQLPCKSEDLWDALVAFDGDSRSALFAHCASLSVNAMHETWNRRPRATAHADRLAETVGLDMAAVGWAPKADNYLGRVTKARILEAVREANGEAASQLIDHLKKPDMAKEAERLLEGTGWLPEPLRTPGHPAVETGADTGGVPDTEVLPAFLTDDEETEAVIPIPAHAIAAE